jgi:pyruvate dehydrogenase E1 component beta subunit
MNNETKLMSVRDAIIMAMSEEMRSDENVFLMGEDVGIFGGDFGTSVGMLEEFGAERIRDTPISENAISGCAIGAAMTGMRPIVDVTFMDFVVYMMDNIVNQAAKTRYMFGGKGQVPVVFRCAAGSGVGSAAQHSQSLESWFCHIPGLKVVAPGTPADVKGLLKASIRDNNPVIFLEYKAQYNMKGEVPLDPDFVLPLGKADLKREKKKNRCWYNFLGFKKVVFPTTCTFHFIPRCRQCNSEDVEIWSDHVCPKCSSEMKKGRLEKLWD